MDALAISSAAGMESSALELAFSSAACHERCWHVLQLAEQMLQHEKFLVAMGLHHL